MSKERFCPECGQPADADERFAGIAGQKSHLSQTTTRPPQKRC